MTNLRKAKFAVRVILTFGIIAFGVAVFFLSRDANMRWAGVTMVTNAWMIWMSSGKAKKDEDIDTDTGTTRRRSVEDPLDPLEPLDELAGSMNNSHED